MAGPINDFRDLIVWQRAIQLAKGVYRLTYHFPRDERFGLTNQLRRASVSVSSNIAEGHARLGREYRSYLSIARGSTAEVQSQLLLAAELEFVTSDDVVSLLACCSEIQRMIAALRHKLPQA